MSIASACNRKCILFFALVVFTFLNLLLLFQFPGGKLPILSHETEMGGLLPPSSPPSSFLESTNSSVPLSQLPIAIANVGAAASATTTTMSHSIAAPPNNFKVVILTRDRFHSLERLIESLKASDYLGDKVDLDIRFDLPPNPTDEWRTRVATFQSNNHGKWTIGNVTYSIANTNLGLRQAWLSAWRPSSPEERAIIFEDDIEVSPLWYKWLKGAFEKYGERGDIAGISLQRQTLVPSKQEQGKASIGDNGGKPFLYKLVGSIGYAPVASKWMDFLDFAECALKSDMSVATPELITSDWYNALDKRTMWTQLFIYFCKYRDLYTLYAFPSHNLALAAHWREKGEHFQSTGGRDFQLVGESSPWQIEYPDDLPKLGWGAEPIKQESKLRTVVLSAAVGYQKGEFERFASSIRMHYDGDVVVLVWEKAQRGIFDVLEKYRIQTLTTPEAGGARQSEAWYKINVARWNFYKEACREDKYDLCMAIDFRDTLFQDDPFRNMTSEVSGESVLHVYQHNLDMNSWHMDLAMSCKRTNEELKGKKIINAGGFIGSPGVFPRLARWVAEESKMCDDQVALNLGVYGNRINSTVVAYPQGRGSINNVGWGGAFQRDSRERFLNHNCFPAPVVHQFDKLD